jgi:hypothetical protein
MGGRCSGLKPKPPRLRDLLLESRRVNVKDYGMAMMSGEERFGGGIAKV